VWLEGAEDQKGLDALMGRTPDLQVSDDQGYVIACLKPDGIYSERRNDPERAIGHLWLSIAAVSRFYPLSTRGARLLEADAERASVMLGEPIFEKTWSDWRDRQIENEAHWRGQSLCAALGLVLPDLTTISSQVSDILAGRKRTPNFAEIRDGAFEGTRALGWVSAMSVALIDPSVKTAFKEMPENGSIKTIIKTLRDDLNLRCPVLDDDVLIQTVRAIDKVLHDLGAEVLPIELMSTILHYQSLAFGGREISLGSLLDDLAKIALEDPQRASLSAYFIGRSMENVAVTTLLYQSDRDRYAALSPASECQQLDVMALAAKRIEDKQPVEPPQLINVGFETVDEETEVVGSIGEAEATNQENHAASEVKDRQHSNLGLEPQNDNNLNFAANSPSTLASPKFETPTADAIVSGEKLLGGNIYEPSSTSIDSFNEYQKLNPEPKGDIFQQAMSDLESVTVSEKSKRNRRKSGKT
jgi:hypothetical protein